MKFIILTISKCTVQQRGVYSHCFATIATIHQLQVSLVSGVVQYLLFCDWLISLNISSLRFIHVVAVSEFPSVHLAMDFCIASSFGYWE